METNGTNPVSKTGKFKFMRALIRVFVKNEKIRKLATSGKLSYPTLERFINRERSLGISYKVF